MTETGATTQTTTSSTAIRRRESVHTPVMKALFRTPATASAANRPHVSSGLYAEADGALDVSAPLDSIKAGNIRASPNLALTIPARRAPVGPPTSVQFQGTADVPPLDHPRMVDLAAERTLKTVAGHGEF